MRQLDKATKSNHQHRVLQIRIPLQAPPNHLSPQTPEQAPDSNTIPQAEKGTLQTAYSTPLEEALLSIIEGSSGQITPPEVEMLGQTHTKQATYFEMQFTRSQSLAPLEECNQSYQLE